MALRNPFHMRLGLTLLMLLLLPVAAAVHAWLFARENLPRLTQEAVTRLEQAGVREPVVDMRFLDIAIRGEAADPESYQKALASIRAMPLVRFLPEAAQLHVTARIRGTLLGERLQLTGWLPLPADVEQLTALLAQVRPDLQLDTTALRSALGVSWPEGVRPPLTVESPMLKSLLDQLRLPAELQIGSTADALVLSGQVPASGLKEALLAALTEVAGSRAVSPEGLKTGPHVSAVSFDKPAALAAFVRSFFKAPGTRSFSIDTAGVPHITGPATRQLESDWLALLRPITGSAKVDSRLDLMPSPWHEPGYQPQSKLPPTVLQSVQQALASVRILFEPGPVRLAPEEQTKLALLTPTLLAAGPSLSLVIGGHPAPDSASAAGQASAKARAAAVLSFLIEQGVPSADISAVAFDAVPPGSPFAPAVPRSVEILVK